jgi:hypothetical protein
MKLNNRLEINQSLFVSSRNLNKGAQVNIFSLSSFYEYNKNNIYIYMYNIYVLDPEYILNVMLFSSWNTHMSISSQSYS